MNAQDLLTAVLGIDCSQLHEETELSTLGWDDAAWQAVGQHVSAWITSPTWCEPSSVITVGGLQRWLDHIRGSQ
jgi:hypothetical protein